VAAPRRSDATVALAALASIRAWFVIDSGYGLVYGGACNVEWVNVPSLLVLLPPWALLRTAGRDPD
jgi:hypothetical protein